MFVKRIGIVVAVCVLSGCASQPSFEYFTQDQARERIVALAGTEVPAGITLRQNYVEKWQRESLTSTFNCTGTLYRSGESLLTFTSQDGNLVRGELSQLSHCGSLDHLAVEGRFNGEFLYVRFVSDDNTAVRRLRIVDGGTTLMNSENYVMLDGALSTYVYPESGGVTSDQDRLTTTYFRATTNAPAAFTSPAQIASYQAQHEALRAASARLSADTEQRMQANKPSFGTLLANALTVATVATDTSGTAYNNYIAANVPELAGLAQAANAMNAAGPNTQTTIQTSSPTGGAGAVTPGSYPTRDNWLAGQPACSGYTVENYQTVYGANANGKDAQLHALCAGAFNYYAMYLNAIRKGYSQSDSNITYGVFDDAARSAVNFYQTAR